MMIKNIKPKKALLMSLLFIACSSQATEYPLDIENCKTTIPVKAKPKKVFVSSTPAIDNMMSLGLFDHIYGVSEDTVPDYPANIPWGEQRKKLKQLTKGDAVLSEEAVLSMEPDFVYASFHWFLHSKETATREVLTKFDIPSYLSPAECDGHDAKPEHTVSFDMIFSELKDIGRVFDREVETKKFVSDLEKRVAAVKEKSEGFKPAKVLWYYSGTGTPYFAGCCGAPQMLGDILKMENVYGGVQSLWPIGNWEVVADANPDFIVVGNLNRAGEGQYAKDKIAFLESNPVTKEMDAVKNKRYIMVDGRRLDASVLSVWALEQVAEARAKFSL